MAKTIYVDNAATTPVSDSVLEAMMPYLKEVYGNPSSLYHVSEEPKAAIAKARDQVAKALNCEPREIFFTSCGTESDNWALKGYAVQMKKRDKTHIITTNIEHHAILHTAQFLESQGFDVTYLPVNEDGLVTAEQVRDAIRPETGLVSIMYANNEVGTIFPIPEIAEVCHEKEVILHTDAVQAVGHVPIDVKAQKIDMLSLSGHKIHAPKGIGALYVRKGIMPVNLLHGGGQERGRRGGTENTAFIVALGQAITDAVENMEKNTDHCRRLRDRLIEGLLAIPATRLNGARDPRLPGNVNVSFEGIEGESILLMLDAYGICASSGSACTSGSLDPSHVLLALGLPHAIAHGSLRLSVSENNTDEEVDYILEHVPAIIERLRNMSPVWDKENQRMIMEDDNLKK
ncbi:cysteine desulfurase NifS [Peptococcus simiae]|uniref:Cysteine desulfurase IscS n=1 Tax=Peptococcus simiae TaxID=1643805 RepID=A0ABW9H052_9FIRM